MARKAPSFLKTGQKDFAKLFGALCDCHSSWQVWSDYVEMTAIAISNTVDRSDAREKREKRYLEIIQQYKPKEQKAFPELVTIMVEAMDANQDQDFLGDLFMALELGNHWKGQFFTPYSVCKMMAEIQCNDAKEKVEQQGWISVSDPACGAGALLIAARNAFSVKGISPDQALFVAQDIDRVAGLMCYIQLSLLGCAGYVVIANTLTDPITGSSPIFPCFNDHHDVWYLPMWYSEAWQMRRAWYALDLAFPAAETQQISPPAAKTQQPEPEQPPAPPPIIFPEVAVGEQLRLF